jgi:SAM-dependent methyltransferase
MAFLDIAGFCPVCEAESRFVAEGVWLRDELKCVTCQSLPRHRALMVAVQMHYPNWREAQIHEGSPVWLGPSKKLLRDAPGYSWSFFDPEHPTGTKHPTLDWRNENIQALTFPAGSFDLFITQDVLEHVYEPHRAVAEIARVLRPGGLHICTVPIVNKSAPSSRRARRTAQGIEHFVEPSYHGDPIHADGTLVTFDWGYDIVQYLDRFSGMHTTMLYIDDISRGIRAEAIEVLIMRKDTTATDLL